MDNENSNLSYEYKEAYVFWMNRQLEYIDLKYMIGNKAFIIDFTIDRYNLYTTKWLDYIDFKSVVNYLLTNNSTIISDNKLIEINAIIKNMNLNRTSINYSLIPAIKINPFWLLGFIEGEGTFGLKIFSPFFQIGQHSKNLKVLQSISLYLQSLPKTFLFSLNTLPPKLSYTLHSRTLVSVISITNIDALYDYLIYFLFDLEFQKLIKINFD